MSRYAVRHSRSSGFTILESLLMIGLMTLLGLVSLSVYRKETDPARKGPGAWARIESNFVPAFPAAGEGLIMPPDTEGPQGKDSLLDLAPIPEGDTGLDP